MEKVKDFLKKDVYKKFKVWHLLIILIIVFAASGGEESTSSSINSSTSKTFSNVIISQFVSVGEPVKVYIEEEVLVIKDIENVKDPKMGFGMDKDGDMNQFKYTDIEFISMQAINGGAKIDIEAYNKAILSKDRPSKPSKKGNMLCSWCEGNFEQGKGYNTLRGTIGQPERPSSKYCSWDCATSSVGR